MAGETSRRGDAVFAQMRERLYRDTDRMFRWLLAGQWLFAIGLVLATRPFSYVHFKLAVGLGALIDLLPIVLIRVRPAWWATRHAVAIAQILWSALLITITGGRIETHFHVFGSLAFLAFYRDWRVLATAGSMVVADHLARGLLFPDSVYGTANPEWWRFLEHAAWVAFELAFLVWSCIRGMRDLRAASQREASLERANAATEAIVAERTLQLEDSVTRYRALVENTEAVPFEYDRATRRVLYVSPHATRMFDCLPLDLPQMFGALVHPDDRARLRGSLDKPRTTNDPIDYRVCRRDKSIVHVRMFLTAHEGGTRGILVDVTRQKQLEHELQQAQKLESVGRLAAGVAHEINTPIQFVGDSVEFIGGAVIDLISVLEKQRAALDGTASVAEARAAEVAVDLPYLLDKLPGALERATDGTQRVARIVRSMKIFAHPPKAEMSEIDLNLAIESTLTIARNEYRYVADVELALEKLPKVTCHAGEINQVILNIVINAAHAIAETHVRGTIRVCSRVVDDDVIVSISDTGCGIPEHSQSRVFEPFFTTKEVGKGTGQGLAIARSVVVDKHRGSLTFVSVPHQGTTFHIRIPIGASAAKAAA